MPRRKGIPKPYWHKPAKQYVVKIAGKSIWLGKDPEQADKIYREEIQRWLANASRAPDKSKGESVLIADLAVAYATVAAKRVSASQLERIKVALEALVEMYGEENASDFDQGKLDKVREALLSRPSRRGSGLMPKLVEILADGKLHLTKDVEAELRKAGMASDPRAIKKARQTLGVKAKKIGRVWWMSLEKIRDFAERESLSRNYVNALIRCIQTCFRWAAGKPKLVPATIALEVCALKALEYEEAGREVEPVMPIDAATVDLTIPHLAPRIRCMVELQRLSGMRPGEVCRMRRCDISTREDEKVMAKIGAGKIPLSAVKAGEVLVWIYCPSTHKTAKRKKVRVICLGPQAQKLLEPYLKDRAPDAFLFSPLEASKEWRESRKRLAKFGKDRQPGKRYTTLSYGQAIERACRRAKIEPWAPNRLRHGVGTSVANDYDQDTAAAVLGHARPDMTCHYILDRLKKAASVIAQDG